MTIKYTPIFVIIFLLLVPKFVGAQSLPPLLLLTVEEIGMRVQDDPYFEKILAEDTDSSGKSETHGAGTARSGCASVPSDTIIYRPVESEALHRREL